MSSCSLYHPVSYNLLSCSELESILLFERVVCDWVREVHMFTSKRKKGKNFVIFRNSSNTRLRGLEAFRFYLTLNGFDVSFLETVVFKSDKNAKIVSNKAGANGVARREALLWAEDVKNNKVDRMIHDDVRRSFNCKSKFKFNARQSKTEIMRSNENYPKEKPNIEIKEDEYNSIITESQLGEQKEIQSTQSMKYSATHHEKKKENTMDGINKFDENTLWLGDKLDMLKDGEISEEEDKSLEKSMSATNCNQTINERKLNTSIDSSSIDYSWMDSFGCFSDNEEKEDIIGDDNDESKNTLKLGPINSSWMESMGCLSNSDEEINLTKEMSKNSKEREEIEFGPIDYSWMDSMGCMSDIEEEESSPQNREKQSEKSTQSTSEKQKMKTIDGKCFASLNLGNIGSSWMESLGSMSDYEEKEKEETNNKCVDSKSVSLIGPSLEDEENKLFSDSLEKCIPWILTNEDIKTSEEMLTEHVGKFEICDNKSSEFIKRSQTKTFINSRKEGIENNLFENELFSNEKMKLMTEIYSQKKESETADIFVGDFCEAWMDCFESIKELDSNVNEKQDIHKILDESLDNRLVKNYTLLDKKTKDNLNHKIAKACSDSSRNTIKEKENDMFELLEKVLLNSDTVDDIDPNVFDNQEIKLLDENNHCSPNNEINPVKKEVDSKLSNIFKFGDAETFRWDLRENLQDFAKQKENNEKDASWNEKANLSNVLEDEEVKANLGFQIKTEQMKKTAAPLSFKDVDSEAGSLFLPSFLKSSYNNIDTNLNDEALPNKSKLAKDNSESICPFSYNLGFYSSTPNPLAEDSDSSYVDDEEKISVGRVTNKKQKRRKLLKGKLKKDENKNKKDVETQNKAFDVGQKDKKHDKPENITISTKCEQKDKSLNANEPNKEALKPADKPGPSPSDYSSNCETDEEDCPHQSEDNMEDV